MAKHRPILTLGLLIGLAGQVLAAVDLVTILRREGTQLTIPERTTGIVQLEDG